MTPENKLYLLSRIRSHSTLLYVSSIVLKEDDCVEVYQVLVMLVCLVSYGDGTTKYKEIRYRVNGRRKNICQRKTIDTVQFPPDTE